MSSDSCFGVLTPTRIDCRACIEHWRIHAALGAMTEDGTVTTMTVVTTIAWHMTRMPMSARHMTRALRPAWRLMTLRTSNPTAALVLRKARLDHPLFSLQGAQH